MPTAARSINKVHAVMEVRAALEALNKNDPNVAKYARAAISRLIQLGVQFEDAA
jgi:hypothetical protein